ncbi:MAG: hypothetical protein VXW87_00960 [Pseudomonadota bacterium]|nr:hypothetical protein [Pseudomonadota bacterium]
MEVPTGSAEKPPFKLSEVVSAGSISSIALHSHQQILSEKLIELFRSLLNIDYNPEYHPTLNPAQPYTPGDGEAYLPLDVLSYQHAWQTITNNIPPLNQQNPLEQVYQRYISNRQPIVPKDQNNAVGLAPYSTNYKALPKHLQHEMRVRQRLRHAFLYQSSPRDTELIKMTSPICIALFSDILSCVNLDRQSLPVQQVQRFLTNIAPIMPIDQMTKLRVLLNSANFGLLLNKIPKKVEISSEFVDPSDVITQNLVDINGKIVYQSVSRSQWVQSILSISRSLSFDEKLSLLTVICAHYQDCLFDSETVSKILSLPDQKLYDALHHYLVTAHFTPKEIEAFLISRAAVETPQQVLKLSTFSRLFSAIEAIHSGDEVMNDNQEILEDIESSLPTHSTSPSFALAQYIYTHFLPKLKTNYDIWAKKFHTSDIIAPQHSKALQVVQYMVTHLDRNILTDQNKFKIYGPKVKQYYKKFQSRHSLSHEEIISLGEMNPVTRTLINEVITLCSKSILTPSGRANLLSMRINPQIFSVGETMLQTMIADTFAQFQEDLIPVKFLGRYNLIAPSSNPTLSQAIDFLIRHGTALPKELSTVDLHEVSVHAYKQVIFGENGGQYYNRLIKAYSQTAKDLVEDTVTGLKSQLKLSLYEIKTVLSILVKLPADTCYRALMKLTVASSSERSSFRALLLPIVRIFLSPANANHIQDSSTYWDEVTENRHFYIDINKAMIKTRKHLNTDNSIKLPNHDHQLPTIDVKPIIDGILSIWSPVQIHLSSTRTKRHPIGSKLRALWQSGDNQLLSLFILQALVAYPSLAVPSCFREILQQKGLLTKHGGVTKEVFDILKQAFPENPTLFALMLLKVQSLFPEFKIPAKLSEVLQTAGIIQSYGCVPEHFVVTLDALLQFNLQNFYIRLRPLPDQEQSLNLLLSSDIKHSAGRAGDAAFRSINSGFVSSLCAPHIIFLRSWLFRISQSITSSAGKIHNSTVRAFWEKVSSPNELLSETDAFREASEYFEVFKTGHRLPLGCAESQDPESITRTSVEDFWADRTYFDSLAQEEGDQPDFETDTDTISLGLSLFSPTQVSSPSYIQEGSRASPDKLVRYLDPTDAPVGQNIVRALFPC